MTDRCEKTLSKYDIIMLSCIFCMHHSTHESLNLVILSLLCLLMHACARLACADVHAWHLLLLRLWSRSKISTARITARPPRDTPNVWPRGHTSTSKETIVYSVNQQSTITSHDVYKRESRIKWHWGLMIIFTNLTKKITSKVKHHSAFPGTFWSGSGPCQTSDTALQETRPGR